MVRPACEWNGDQPDVSGEKRGARARAGEEKEEEAPVAAVADGQREGRGGRRNAHRLLRAQVRGWAPGTFCRRRGRTVRGGERRERESGTLTSGALRPIPF